MVFCLLPCQLGPEILVFHGSTHIYTPFPQASQEFSLLLKIDQSWDKALFHLISFSFIGSPLFSIFYFSTLLSAVILDLLLFWRKILFKWPEKKDWDLLESSKEESLLFLVLLLFFLFFDTLSCWMVSRIVIVPLVKDSEVRLLPIVSLLDGVGYRNV